MACSVISHKQQLARCKEVKCSNKDLHLLNLRLQMFSNAEGGFNVCAVPPQKKLLYKFVLCSNCMDVKQLISSSYLLLILGL